MRVQLLAWLCSAVGGALSSRPVCYWELGQRSEGRWVKEVKEAGFWVVGVRGRVVEANREAGVWVWRESVWVPTRRDCADLP